MDRAAEIITEIATTIKELAAQLVKMIESITARLEDTELPELNA